MHLVFGYIKANNLSSILKCTNVSTTMLKEIPNLKIIDGIKLISADHLNPIQYLKVFDLLHLNISRTVWQCWCNEFTISTHLWK